MVVREERLLVIRRSQSVVAPGAYCFPGGGIEPGESEEQALVREMREELEAAVIPRRRIWSSVTPWRVELAWWRADFLPGTIPIAQPAEIESLDWYTPAEMARLPNLLASNRLFLETLERGDIKLD